ncbi:uncharacterized protein EHS24_001936 [Apiotrichum porosum]|uniref:Uncharacterized protein n=1 Tax=Apiotrichum porosum TaxID=105984 RepID=A0A427XJD0_9TREE|nr:uncharacterized protein EHS24_001936 [Apiotrichum porosum]RSH79009.1 hypothetical protein EHS24_001936 [Apiotrichum porosum]
MVKLRPEPATRGPAVFIQLIEFACGSLAIGVAAQHVLLDARALALFMGDWATRARGAHPSPRTYEPLSLDVHAAGDVDAEWADAQLETTALQIPQLRLDFWSQRPGHPEDVGPAWFSSPRSPAAAIDEQDVASGRRRGRRVPWDDWRWDQSTLDRTIEFLPEQVEAAYRLAGGDGTSRLDAVLGCVWAAVVRGRDLPPTTEVRLHTSVDLRRRVTPPLDDTFLGAPLINVMSSSSAGSLTLSSGARAVRAAVDSLASDAVPALLHHMSFALDPVREWNCFLGERDVLTTSWLGAGCYDVDFGFGPPSVVQPGMPPVDGLLVAMDVPGAAGRREDKWYNSGVRVRLILRKEVMDKVLADPALRPEE